MSALDQLIAWLTVPGVPLGPVLFVVFVLSTMVCLPASGLTLAIGAVLGVGPGAAVAFSGTVVSAAVTRLVARGRFGRWVRGWIDRSPRLSLFHRALLDGGWRLVLLTRLSPALPLGPAHWVFAFVDLPLPRYLLVTGLATFPAQLMWLNLGSTGRKSLKLWTHPEDADAAQWALVIMGVVATIGSVVFLTTLTRRRLRTELARAAAPSEPVVAPSSHG